MQPHAFQAHLLSLVHEGVFAKFPTLTVVLIEAGFTWLPQFLWRANKTWRAMRAEVPSYDQKDRQFLVFRRPDQSGKPDRDRRYLRPIKLHERVAPAVTLEISVT